MQVEEGNSYVEGKREHLTIGIKRGGKRGRDEVLCSNAARAEDEVEGRKTGAATSTGATTNEDEEKYKFDSRRILL